MANWYEEHLKEEKRRSGPDPTNLTPKQKTYIESTKCKIIVPRNKAVKLSIDEAIDIVMKKTLETGNEHLFFHSYPMDLIYTPIVQGNEFCVGIEGSTNDEMADVSDVLMKKEIPIENPIPPYRRSMFHTHPDRDKECNPSYYDFKYNTRTWKDTFNFNKRSMPMQLGCPHLGIIKDYGMDAIQGRYANALEDASTLSDYTQKVFDHLLNYVENVFDEKNPDAKADIIDLLTISKDKWLNETMPYRRTKQEVVDEWREHTMRDGKNLNPRIKKWEPMEH